MPSIGSFGSKRPDVDLDFLWCDTATIRVNPKASDLGFTEFMAKAHDIELPDDVENMSAEEMAAVLNSMTAVTAAVYRLMKDLIHPEDWAEFWALAKENNQQNADLIQLSRDIQAAVTEVASGFPTGPPSDSADMPSSTRPRSLDESSSRRERRQAARTAGRSKPMLTPVEHRRQLVRERAMETLSGRPDLKVALLRSSPDDMAGQTG